MSSTAAPPDARIHVLLDDVLESPDEQFAATSMSPVAELTVGELLAFEFTRPDLTATLAVSEFEPTFHEHQIRTDSNTRVLFNKAHNLRELYASGYRSIEVRSPCTSIVEHMPIGSSAFWQHLDSVEQLKSTISDNIDWLSTVKVDDKRDAAYIKLARAKLLALHCFRPYGMPLFEDGYLITLDHLLEFLGTDFNGTLADNGTSWLSMDTLDIAMKSIHASNPRHASISDLVQSSVVYFSQQHDCQKRRQRFEGDLHLVHIRARVLAGECKIIYMPLNLEESRPWVIARADVKKKTWELANSLKACSLETKTREAALDVLNFLNVVIPSTQPPTVMPIPQQLDGDSCGPACISILEKDCLGLPSFDPSIRAILRVRQFLRLAHECLVASTYDTMEDVNASLESELSQMVLETATETSRNVTSVLDILASSENLLPSGSITVESAVDPLSSSLEKATQHPNTIAAWGELLSSKTSVDPVVQKKAPSSKSQSAKGDHKHATKLKQEGQNAEWSLTVSRPRDVTCRRCANVVKLHRDFDVTRFENHLTKCRGSQQSNGSITGFLTRAADPPRPLQPPQCPGLREGEFLKYLEATSTIGGGATPRHEIIMDLFSKRAKQFKKNRSYDPLDDEEKQQVDLEEEAHFVWVNNHALKNVKSKSCTSKGSWKQLGPKPQALACIECRNLLLIPTFRKALIRKRVTGKTAKYTRNAWKGASTLISNIYKRYAGLECLFDGRGKRTPFLRFAQGVAKKKFKGTAILSGMIEAPVIRSDREAKGASLRGYRRNQALLNYEHALALASPATYRIHQASIGGSTFRKFRALRATVENLQLGIHMPTILLVAAYLREIGGTFNLHVGPQSYELVGTEGNPIPYDTSEALQALFGGADPPVAGTKVGGWCFLPRVPNQLGARARLFAAFVIGDKVDTSASVAQMVDILETIERCKLSDMLASISADGAATEGVIQREVAAIFERKLSNQQAAWKIPPPSLSSSVFSPVEISSVWIGTTPTAMSRDPKHVGKNLLNSSNSGGRAIIGGTGCVGHQDFLTLIRVEDSSRKTLYNRDVEKRDRQDDNAAHRAFSAATLELAADECNAGNLDQEAVVFLFLCGELHDAIQNRSLQPLERVKMLLTVCYAFEGWSKFVRVFPEYSGDHFLSAATLDGVYKMVEHFFGSLRKIVPEFDALDFLQT
ncbi:BQ5605_C002g01664 [Microbotryum silenes-dioicae]|uniref:BQ5605_C002g01664 protein n=1 Tax=Microbotryum silenes-dioicae TaxID=796604 RepID=A0A2X0NWV3_9BASI|nr:BQ5605_C002g01664 [Microbotryum silenes-dioicae]